MAVTSPRRMLISGCDAIASVTRDENKSRSTASAAPAGTRVSSAARMISDPRRRISSFSRPTALSSLSPRNEFEQTSSAKPSVLWTGVGRTGRISCRTTGTPRDATCHAASEPASPPPTMVTRLRRGSTSNSQLPIPTVTRLKPGFWRLVGRWELTWSGGRQLLRLTHVAAVVVVANQLAAVLLRDLLDEERRLAL